MATFEDFKKSSVFSGTTTVLEKMIEQVQPRIEKLKSDQTAEECKATMEEIRSRLQAGLSVIDAAQEYARMESLL